MSDTKDEYSAASTEFVSEANDRSERARQLYQASKQREARHNNQWIKHPVDINKVVNRFTPGSTGRREGVKYIFSGPTHRVVADMAAGYLRVYSNSLRSYVDMNGLAGNAQATHFKIKRREEM